MPPEFLRGFVKMYNSGIAFVQCCKKGEIKFKEGSKKFGMKFRDGCTTVVSPGVGVWGVGEFPGFQGASKASPPDPPICYPSPRPDIRPHSLNCLTFFVETRAGRGAVGT